jgi:hypothetical protein
MTDYMRKHPGNECPPPPEHPARQPNPPSDGKDCQPFPETEPPELKDPEKCPPPDKCCKCPSKPDTPSNCLEDLIAQQGVGLDTADNAAKFKKELEGLLEKAKTARQLYTRDTYEDLVEEWVKQDVLIAELIRKLVCAVPCWRCILDCHVCPLLNELHYAETWLYDDGQVYKDVHDLYDLEYWYKRDLAAKKCTFDRITSILAAWEKPVLTITDALKANKALHDAASTVIGTEPGKAIYDVFLRLVPLHLAIAPPAGPNTTTKIDKKFTKFCECDDRPPEWCCGINVAERSLRQRLIGPQPYLIDPNQYFDLICCLVKNRYAPSQAAFNKADASLKGVQSRISNYEKQLTDWPKDFEKNAKGAIPSAINCCDYEPDDDDQNGSSESS